MILIPFIIGCLLSFVSLLLMRQASKIVLVFGGLILFGAMLAVYVGAYLVSENPSHGYIALLASTLTFGLALILTLYRPAFIGAFIFMHGIFDHVFGLHAGLPIWYPPFCLGIDVVAGLGLIWMLRNQRNLS